jgi:C-terminal processing protease CtpA/Prc
MKTDACIRFARIVRATGAAFLAAAIVGTAWGQQAQPPASPPSAEAAREKAKDKIEAARETQQGARQATQDVREGARDTARDTRQTGRDTREGTRDAVRDTREGARDAGREGRQTVRDTREGARDTARDDRQTIRESRRDVREARREFIASRIRSGDLGLWLRQAANASGVTVADVSGRGAISQTGLKEGDEIVSINGQMVNSEREFVDLLFADHAGDKPVAVVIKRNGQQMTISVNTKAFVEEHLASDTKLQDFGLILDESDASRVKVQAVIPRSPAFYAGVRSGDQITGFNGQRIAAVADFIRSIAANSGETARMDVNRNNQNRQLNIEVPNAAQEEARTALRPTLPETAPAAPQRPQAAPQGGTRPAQPAPGTLPRPNPPR